MDELICQHYFCSDCAEKGKDNTHRNKLLVSPFTWTALTDDTNRVNQFHCGERLEGEHLHAVIAILEKERPEVIEWKRSRTAPDQAKNSLEKYTMPSQCLTYSPLFKR